MVSLKTLYGIPLLFYLKGFVVLSQREKYLFDNHFSFLGELSICDRLRAGQEIPRPADPPAYTVQEQKHTEYAARGMVYLVAFRWQLN